MIQSLLEKIVQNKDHHAKWLNSLSFLENCGARKISKSEHRSDVDIMVLKHAAEEHRHAFYLKKMILAIMPFKIPKNDFESRRKCLPNV